MKKKLKLLGIFVISLLILIVILQNTENVRTDILLFTIEMPRALLLFGTALLGFIAGLITSFFMLKAESSKKRT